MSNSEANQYYTYVLTHPLNNIPFYVGYSGREERIDEHFGCKKSDKNILKKNAIKEIQKAGLNPVFIKIIENVDKQTAIRKEIEMISYYGRADKGLGSLYNKTNGGDGGRELENLSGQKFNKLTVLEYMEHSKWLCICECGDEKIIASRSLKNGNTKSCGCLTKERLSTHKKTKSQTYKIYMRIKDVCYNINSRNYKDCGKNGIIMCARWLDSFENFLEDMGETPSNKHIFGRIDTSKDYEPSNCKWMTRKEMCSFRNKKRR